MVPKGVRIGGILANNKKVWWKRRREKRAFTRFRLIYVSADCSKTIGVHYDQIFLCHGEDSILTAWIPIGDTKANGGGLIYLDRS
jgi:hypothetical protein